MRYRSFFLVISVSVFLISAFAHAEFGNRFIANKRLSVSIDSSIQKMSFRFTCQDDITVTAASVYCAETLHAPAYLVSLQDDVNGQPSGTALASYSIVPKVQSWNTVPLNAVPLAKGRVYHLVVEPDMLRGGGHPVAVIGHNNYASFLTTDVLNHLHPNDGSPDLQSNSLFFDKGQWKELDQEPVYALFGLGAKSQGNPYDDPGIRPIYGKVEQGECLHFLCTCNVQNIAFRVRKKGQPTTPLTFKVLINDFYAHKAIPYYKAVAITPDQISSNFQWVTVGIPAPTSNGFRAECWFYILQSESGKSLKDSADCEDCYQLSDVGNTGGLAGAADLTFDGGPHLSRAVYSMDGSDPFHWIDEFERDANINALNSPCPAPETDEFKPIPTPIPLEDQPRLEP